jgi:Rab-GTPase-TBC domain
MTSTPSCVLAPLIVHSTSAFAGLALIAGNLLLQTHEEDSFWTFVSLMDRHFRGYFSPTAKLLEIDSMLFGRAVATADKSLAARLFVIPLFKPTEHETDSPC